MTTWILVAVFILTLLAAKRIRGKDRPELMGRPNAPCDTRENLEKVLRRPH